ncbi:papain-like cysteine protease family protein [Actinokineospora terrae]|uniref:Peptidase_C39 like family protein n=1 Tax=Actinokineospora terrae TaxID=155974 RepID=A0A1H9LR47_9PSEU|nr:papain-like cysteine protease family protein [Actinokineospora terrae]SER13343.1 Peptidase_C39 like family protein [Actinokineospora terrae]
MRTAHRKTGRRLAVVAGFAGLLAATALVVVPSADAGQSAQSASASAGTPLAGGARPAGIQGAHAARDNSALRIPSAASAAVPSGAAASYYLRYTQQVQKYNQWCWAADGSSIEQYYGATTTQDQFCAAAKGTQVGYCPNEAGALYQIVNGFRRTGFTASQVGNAMSWSSTVAQVTAGQPIMTVISWTSGGAHAEVIYGYDATNGTISVGDPWVSYNRYWTSSYNSYLSNSQFAWTDSVSGIRKA